MDQTKIAFGRSTSNWAKRSMSARDPPLSIWISV